MIGKAVNGSGMIILNDNESNDLIYLGYIIKEEIGEQILISNKHHNSVIRLIQTATDEDKHVGNYGWNN